MAASSTHQWFKSSYSGGNATECVECAHVSHGTLVRDSKQATGPVVPVGSEAWRRFVGAVGRGGMPAGLETACST
ncbi:DUF397 domain-containing protein [Streptomyces sp. NPDC051041]|uniref:DUF397 domain-containing protein n=1 Tax=Streptomyces sp. NPDC051041 TaxID=3365640 RepID=UPI00378EFBEE